MGSAKDLLDGGVGEQNTKADDSGWDGFVYGTPDRRSMADRRTMAAEVEAGEGAEGSEGWEGVHYPSSANKYLAPAAAPAAAPAEAPVAAPLVAPASQNGACAVPPVAAPASQEKKKKKSGVCAVL